MADRSISPRRAVIAGAAGFVGYALTELLVELWGPHFARVTFVPIALLGPLYYVVLPLCVWKSYQMLSKINDDLAGIRQAIDRNAAQAPEE